MSNDRTSFDSTPLTIGSLWRIIIAVCALLTATATALGQLYPPELSDSDKRMLAEARKTLDDFTTSTNAAAQQTMAAREDLKCALIEIRAHFDAADDLGPRATPEQRKSYRYSRVKNTLTDTPGCERGVPAFERAP